MLKIYIDGEEMCCLYLICVGMMDYDCDGELCIGIKCVCGGCFLNFVFDMLKFGYMIDVMILDGCFFMYLNVDYGKQYVVFLGGLGIMLVFVIVKMMFEFELCSMFMLIYGNCSVDVIMFVEEFEDLKNCYMNCFVFYYVLLDDLQDVELFNGVFDQVKCLEFFVMLILVDVIDEVFICGLVLMMDVVEVVLKVVGVLQVKVYVECFGMLLLQVGVLVVEIIDQMLVVDFEIVFDGKKCKLCLLYEGVSLFDVGLCVGFVLLYVCKGGVCCICCVKVVEGEVWMEKNYMFEEYEVEDGFVLMCQCYLISDKVVVSFDEC